MRGYWALPDTEQHRAEQRAFADRHEQRQLFDVNGSGYTDPTNYLTPVGRLRHRRAVRHV